MKLHWFGLWEHTALRGDSPGHPRNSIHPLRTAGNWVSVGDSGRLFIQIWRNHCNPGEGNEKGIEWKKPPPPDDSHFALWLITITKTWRRGSLVTLVNFFFKERILPINNHEICLSSLEHEVVTHLSTMPGSTKRVICKREKQNICDSWGCSREKVKRTHPCKQEGNHKAAHHLYR